jgi:hypothetical protein
MQQWKFTYFISYHVILLSFGNGPLLMDPSYGGSQTMEPLDSFLIFLHLSQVNSSNFYSFSALVSMADSLLYQFEL